MLIAQITDAHVGLPGQLFYGRFDTGAALSAAVAAVNRLDPRPDVVLFTGDLTDKGTPEEFAYVRSLLASLEIPLFVIPGNHDKREPMREAFAGDGYLRSDTPYLHYAIEDWPLRLIGLDTVDPEQFGAGELCAERLNWLDETLSAQPARPTLVFMHHPPFDTGIVHMDRIQCANGDSLEQVVRRHPQIVRVLCGHVHRPVQVSFGGTTALIAPSVAHQLPLDLRADAPSAFVFEPPAFMLHKWRKERGLVSHTQYIGDYGPAIGYRTGEPVS